MTTGIALKIKKSVPSNDEISNTLTNCGIFDKNYKYFLNVWKSFKMNTIKDCHGF